MEMQYQPQPVPPSVAAEVKNVSDLLWPFLSSMSVATLLLAWAMESVFTGLVGALLLGFASALYFLHVLFNRYVRREDNRRG